MRDSLEVHVLAGEGPVDGREGVELVLEEVLVLGVKVASESQHFGSISRNSVYSHSDQLATVGRDSGALANDLRGPDEVSSIFSWDGGEGARTGRFCFWAEAEVSLGLGENPAWDRKTMYLSTASSRALGVSLSTATEKVAMRYAKECAAEG